MNNIAIIAEYNPFHNGHKFQIDKIREIFGLNCNIICIMSGNFVQRGDFSLYDKHTRANCAVLGGANLVLELPLPYAVSSAEFFAFGAISVLNSLNLVDYLCFGSEHGDIDTLFEVSKTLLDDNFNKKVQELIKTGISYPNALDMSLSFFNEDYSKIIRSPNNTLGIEYIKSLIKTNSTIKPITITRKNTGYHSDFEKDNIASASYIRKNTDFDTSHLMPENCFNILKNSNNFSMKRVENSILSFLKRKDYSFFENIRDCNEGLEHKIVTSLKSSLSLIDLQEKLKSKRYTNSRISRIILNSYLELDKTFTTIQPKYAKVLAFDDNGRKILKNLKETCNIPVITKPASDYNFCDEGKKLINADILATDLFFMSCSDGNFHKSSFEMTKSPIYVKNN